MIFIALTNQPQSITKIVIYMSVIILILNIMWISFSEKMYVFDKYMININLISGYKKIDFNEIKTVCYFVFPGDSQAQHKVNLKKYIKQNSAYNIGKYNVYLLYDYNENIICALQDVFLQNTDIFNLDLKLKHIPIEKID